MTQTQKPTHTSLSLHVTRYCITDAACCVLLRHLLIRSYEPYIHIHKDTDTDTHQSNSTFDRDCITDAARCSATS